MITALIPVLNRPKNVRPLVESFYANSVKTSSLLFIVQEDDIEELEEINRAHPRSTDYGLGLHIVPSHIIRWSQKLNAAHRFLINADGPGPDLLGTGWYLLGADDLRFHKGWDDNERLRELVTMKRREDELQIGVIGTNDLGNPAVIAGKHSTHPLMRVSYVERYGIQEAAGLICPEIYYHCFVDNEIVATARKRQAYAHCHESIVEHLHPAWQKSSFDETYKIGAHPKKFVDDRKLFEARSSLYDWPKWNE